MLRRLRLREVFHPHVWANARIGILLDVETNRPFNQRGTWVRLWVGGERLRGPSAERSADRSLKHSVERPN